MSLSLERVSTTTQTSMGTISLPLELQQQVFSYLDTKSFHAARCVCKWWRYASIDAITLAKQLKKLPILSPVDTAKCSPWDLQELFHEAAYTLMLGMRVQRLPDAPGSLSTAAELGFAPSPKITSTRNGTKLVTIYDRTIALFDTSGDQPVLLSQRPINDMKETVGNGPWLKMSNISYELALSSDGSLLAIAQERTIQIYDLTAEPDSFTVNTYIASAAGHYICGVDFEQNDYVLRVRLSGKGTVLYLGTPSPHPDDAIADTDHWKSKAGLKHVFLDSSLLSLQSASQERLARISGLQLLRPLQSGFLFASQRHGGDESSHYILGHVRCSMPRNAHAATAEPGNVTVLARMESFLSAWKYTLNGVSESGMGMWENMPSAHEHHPHFALSLDSTSLIIAERDQKAVRSMPLTQLFLYRLPCEWSLTKSLAESSKRDQDALAEVQSHSVARIPLCLTTIQGDVTGLGFEEVASAERRTLRFGASTAETTRQWLFEEAV